MSRIKLSSRVSTESWHFDSPTVTIEEDKWSWKVFGKKWLDSRVYGTVLGKNGRKWQVKWDLTMRCHKWNATFWKRKMTPHLHKYLVNSS